MRIPNDLNRGVTLRLVALVIVAFILANLNSAAVAQTNGSGSPVVLQEEFSKRKLKRGIWDIQIGDATTSDGRLILAGSANARAEIQSKDFVRAVEIPNP